MNTDLMHWPKTKNLQLAKELKALCSTYVSKLTVGFAKNKFCLRKCDNTVNEFKALSRTYVHKLTLVSEKDKFSIREHDEEYLHYEGPHKNVEQQIINRQTLAKSDIFSPPGAAKGINWFFENCANSDQVCRNGKCFGQEIPGPLTLCN